jgi:hypothetical protein
MAEEMAEAKSNKPSNPKRNPTRATTKTARNSSPKKTPEPGADDGAAAAEAEDAIHQEQLKARRDPAKVVNALRKVVRIAIANDLKGLALGMIDAAKKGNTIAMKLLIDLCNVVDPDGGEDGSGAGFRTADLFGSGFDWKSLLEAENPATSEPAEAGIDVSPDINIGGREPE